MTLVMSALDAVRLVSDAELMSRLHRLVGGERSLSTKLLVHIGEVDARGLYREAAFSSMFSYCVSKLHMSDAEALLRIYAARQGRAYPLVLELHAQGVLHLTAIKLIGPHLTPDNHAQLLERAKCKSRREVELLVAEIAPKPDVASSLTRGKLSSPSSARTALAESTQAIAAQPAMAISNACGASTEQQPGAVCVDELRLTVAQRFSDSESGSAGSTNDVRAVTAAADSGTPIPRPVFALSPPPRAVITPLSPGRFKLQVTLGQQAHDHLQQLRDLLRHQNPSGDLALLIERALELLHEKTLKQRFALGTATKRVTAAKTLSASGTQRSTQSGPASEAAPLLASSAHNELASEQAMQSGACDAARAPARDDNGVASASATQSGARDVEPEPVCSDWIELASAHAMQSGACDAASGPASSAQNELASARAMQSGACDAASGLPSLAQTELGSAHAMQSGVCDAVPGPESYAQDVLASARDGSMKRRSRYVPRAVVRVVYARDGGQCTFVSADGQRCQARCFLELHHHGVAFAHGGEASVENLRLACRAHNALWAELEMGRDFIFAKRGRLLANTVSPHGQVQSQR